jgi:hypothetical protein
MGSNDEKMPEAVATNKKIALLITGMCQLLHQDEDW